MSRHLVLSLRLLSLLTAATAVAACETSLTASGSHQPSRPADCEFRIFTVLPGPGYIEVGTVDVTPGPYGANVYRDLGGFYDKIRPLVCQAGGDAALAQANGLGMYIKATVLKYTGEVPVVAVPQPAAISGCQFDTQCKGERVCVQGACVDPVKKAQ